MGKILAWLQLFRAPNIFTLFADGFMAFYITHPDVMLAPCGDEITSQELGILTVVLIGSALLYFSGMVMNDVHDYAEDRIFRPLRPLPSGRISQEKAAVVGWCLLISGLMLETLACGLCQITGISCSAPVVIVSAFMLAGCILAYNSRLKDSVMGPVLMGLCRALNLLMIMGFSTLGFMQLMPGTGRTYYLVLLSYGLYIAGITLYARAETQGEMEELRGEEKSLEMGKAQESSRETVSLGVFGALTSFVLIFLGIYMLTGFLRGVRSDNLVLILNDEPHRWTVLLLLLALLVTYRCFSSLISGRVFRIRYAVKQALFTLFILDASLVYATHGLMPALWVLSLALPAVILGRKVYST